MCSTTPKHTGRFVRGVAGPRMLAIVTLTALLAVSVVIGVSVGNQHIDLTTIFSDPFSQTLFFRLRLPRVLMGLVIGASLAVCGAALQAIFTVCEPESFSE